MLTETKIEPSWLITTPDKKVIHTVPFGELRGQKDQITSATLLWRVNSYYVDVVRKRFVVNGGQHLHIDGLEGKTVFQYARRTKLELSHGSNNGGEKRVVTYLIGITAENREILLEISEDGAMWRWRGGR